MVPVEIIKSALFLNKSLKIHYKFLKRAKMEASKNPIVYLDIRIGREDGEH